MIIQKEKEDLGEDQNKMGDLATFKKEFDIHLKKFLESKISNIKHHTKNRFVIDYINHANEIAILGGKRIRPFIAYLSYFAFGGEEKEIIKVLVSLEIFHLFALIHDDIMDEDKIRHGISTSHLYIAQELKKRESKNYEHYGLSQAILVGDLFFSWAWEILSLNSKNDVRKLFSEMVDETAIGQMLDIESKSNKNMSSDLMYEINYLKTARYTFIYPLLIGASLSRDLKVDEKKFLKELGLNLGMAFQAQDDIFDSDNEKHIESQKKLIKFNMENAKKLVEESKMEKVYKEKFLEFIVVIEKRKF